MLWGGPLYRVIASPGLRWGTVGEYVAGVGTFVAAVIAYIALHQERAQTKEVIALDRERWKSEVEERERWQAKFVSCYVHERHSRTGQNAPYVIISYANNSPGQVFNLSAVKFNAGSVSVCLEEPPFNPPNGCYASRQMSLLDSEIVDLPDSDIGIVFRDSSGVEWVRFANGDLAKLRGNRADGLSVVARVKLVMGALAGAED